MVQCVPAAPCRHALASAPSTRQLTSPSKTNPAPTTPNTAAHAGSPASLRSHSTSSPPASGPKRKPNDIQSALLGVFWFTYFNAPYVAFFGEDKFNSCPGVERSGDGSITIVLGDSLKSVTRELRERSAAALGKESFVNPRDVVGKQRGRFALTFPQLRAQR